MKKIILIMDEDPVYSKKFCNQAIKIYGKKYLFLTFSNIKNMKEYAKENKVESILISESFLENIEDVKTETFYILNEKSKVLKKEGKKTYVYRLQNIKNILDLIDNEISKKVDKSSENATCKIIFFYSPIYVKNKIEIIKRIAKYIGKKKKVLIVDFDEFDNYKGSVGLSNIIFNYKENLLTSESIKKEIISEKEQDYIKSVTYPEDFNVASNIELSNIVNEMKNVGYDYIFINADTSYIKSQYICNDADEIILIKDKDGEKVEKVKNYLKMENQVDYKKITELDMANIDAMYLKAFIKQCFESKYE